MSTNGKLQGKVALVTGAGRGAGPGADDPDTTAGQIM